ncbi:MAG: hypothetical protein ABI599_10085 [Flavobacteriales bacterium]
MAALSLLLLASCAPTPKSEPAAKTQEPTTEVPATEVTDTVMYVYGVAKDYMTGDTLRAYVVTTWDVNDRVHAIARPSTPDGRYDLLLNKAAYYAIEYAAAGYVPKVVEIDMRIQDSLLWEGGYGMNVNTSLVPKLEGLDAAALPTVVGKAHYDAATDNFVWDLDYTERASARQAEVLKAYAERKRGR